MIIWAISLLAFIATLGYISEKIPRFMKLMERGVEKLEGKEKERHGNKVRTSKTKTRTLKNRV